MSVFHVRPTFTDSRPAEVNTFLLIAETHQDVRVRFVADGMNGVPLSSVALLRRIWKEYVEMPGLRLTCEQAQRLWAADADLCASLLDALVDLRFLLRGPDGKYARLTGAAEEASTRQLIGVQH